MLKPTCRCRPFTRRIFFSARERLLAKAGGLALATVVLLAVSLAWITAVDLTPASQRPPVGSSGGQLGVQPGARLQRLARLLGQRFGRGVDDGLQAALSSVLPATGRAAWQGGSSDVSNWVSSACTPLQLDSSAGGSGQAFGPGRGGGTIYDCAAG